MSRSSSPLPTSYTNTVIYRELYPDIYWKPENHAISQTEFSEQSLFNELPMAKERARGTILLACSYIPVMLNNKK